jgi:hypothetical protein
MMYALISPAEKVFDASGNVLGERVAEVAAVTFPVASPLFWVSCADDVVADQFYWANDEILPIPPPPPPPPPAEMPEGGGPAVL